MNAADRQLQRERILQAVVRAASSGLPAAAIADYCRAKGFVIEPAALAAELAYLQDKGLLLEHSAALCAGLKRYRLTAAARAYLEAENLI